MPDQAWVPLAAAQVALLFTLSLARGWWRSRRPQAASWTVALGCLTLGAAALWYGSAFGWSSPSFRVYYVFGGLLGVPWLALGQLQLLVGAAAGRRAQLLLGGASVVAGFLVGVAPFAHGGTVSGSAVPPGSLFGALPRVLVGVSNAVGVTLLVGGVVVSWRRSRRAGAAASSRTLGLALVVAGALAAAAGGTLSFLGRANANGVGVLVGLSLVYAGSVQVGRPVGRHRGRAAGRPAVARVAAEPGPPPAVAPPGPQEPRPGARPLVGAGRGSR